MNEMLIGAIAAVSLIAALFFMRFWRNTHDRLFLFFALSFAIEAANRVVLVLSGGLREDSPSYYIVRLVAYSLILIAILDKNRPRRGR